jgi:hypothetical protein
MVCRRAGGVYFDLRDPPAPQAAPLPLGLPSSLALGAQALLLKDQTLRTRSQMILLKETAHLLF